MTRLKNTRTKLTRLGQILRVFIERRRFQAPGSAKSSIRRPGRSSAICSFSRNQVFLFMRFRKEAII